MELLVECTAGITGEPEPAVIWFGLRSVAVQSILDRWYGSHHRWWKVSTTDGQYVLQRDEITGEWTLAAVPRL
jgi:hypothetical protein